MIGAMGVGPLVSQHRQLKGNQKSVKELKMAVEQVFFILCTYTCSLVIQC